MNKLCPFKWFVLQNFPFIEEDFDAITNYQLLCKVVEYLNKTIDKTNELGTEVEALNNWFNNLDVQDEINNKLDEMAESGELLNIIAQYLQVGAILTFNTVNDMISSTSLVEGSVARTLGKNTLNDLKGAIYKIVVLQSHVADGINTISLGRNDLYAQLIYENKIKVFNTLQNLKQDTNLTIYDFIKTMGYNNINDNGQGFYYIVNELSQGEVANNGDIVELQNGLYAKLIIDKVINIKQFGAIGDNDTDDTNAIQNAINYSVNNYYKKIYVPEGVYKITSTLSTPQAFNQPIISGENTQTCIFNFSTSTEDCLKIKGGSGRLCKSYIENITFIGNANIDTTAIVLADVCGYDVINCRFQDCKRGVKFFNEYQNAFTEFCVIKNSRFEGSCHIAVEYVRGNGTESFHGSGIKECEINQDSNETDYKIIINSNCLVYNSPLDFICWKYNTSLEIINNLSNINNLRQTFYGNIKLELSTGDNQFILTGTEIFYCGDVLILGGYAKIQNINFCEKVAINPDRTLLLQRKPYIKSITLNQATNNVLRINNKESYLIHIYLHTAFYEYQYVILATGRQSNESIAITELQVAEDFNQAGYGGVTFGNSGRNLTITNSQYASHSVDCDMYITPLTPQI